MAELKISDLREKDQDSLVNLEKELTENLFAARLQKRTGQLENTAKISLTKRDLARVKTVLRARELGLEVIETPAAGGGTKPAGGPKAEKPAAKAAVAKAAKKEEKKKGKAKPAAKAKATAKKSEKSEKKAEKPATKKAGKSAGKKK